MVFLLFCLIYTSETPNKQNMLNICLLSWNGSIFVPQSTSHKSWRNFVSLYPQNFNVRINSPWILAPMRLQFVLLLFKHLTFLDTSKTAKYNNAIMQPSYFIQKSWISFCVLSHWCSMVFKVNLNSLLDWLVPINYC